MRIKKETKIKIAFAFIGAISGFLYWKFIGCTTGTCPIKSVWYFSTLWGMAAGYLAGDILLGIIFYLKQKCDDKTVQ
jgi:hypothetical protein